MALQPPQPLPEGSCEGIGIPFIKQMSKGDNGFEAGPVTTRPPRKFPMT